MLDITEAHINVAEVEAAVTWSGAGAVLTFKGVARDSFEGRSVTGLVYEAYRELALPVLEQIVEEVAVRWSTARVAIVHRTGSVAISEPSVVISVAAPHRDECYAASRYTIDRLKEILPVWKKEVYAQGSSWKTNDEAFMCVGGDDE